LQPIAAARVRQSGRPGRGIVDGQLDLDASLREAQRQADGCPGSVLATVRQRLLCDVPADIADAAQDFVGEPGPGMFGEPWPLPAWPAVPTRVLAPRDDRLFPSLFSAASPGSGSTLVVEELPGGHVPMLARSRELAARLAGAVT